MVRLAAYGGLSTAAAAYVVLSAFRQRSNFFAAAVYLSKSNASMMLLWNFGIFLTIIFGRAVQTIFFGPLRLIEIERMHERVWYAITESLLALTIFREAFDTSFVILFVSLLFLKVFHWLASDRVEMMEQAPTIPRLFHFRTVTLLSLLWIVDVALVAVAADSILTEGPSVMIMFASEYMILLAGLLGTTLKYGGNAYDLRNDIPWENKSVYTFYVELACDFLKLATYLCFFSLILTFYGLPLNILRDVYITTRSFINKVRDLSRYRQATRNMDQRYPNATVEEMERLSDKTCIICREEMEARTEAQIQARDSRQGPNETPKKLPCGHIFHFHCLRSWLERQQSCPTCRRSVISSSTAPIQQPQIVAPPAPAQGPATQPQANTPRSIASPGSSSGPAPTRSDAPANVHLSVPPPGTSRASRPASNTARGRSGPENPLIAFQLRSASKPPAMATTPGPTTAKNKSPRPGVLDTSGHKKEVFSFIPETSGSQKQEARSPTPSSSTQAGSQVAGLTGLEAQRQQRLEAALRRRGFASPDNRPSDTTSTVDVSRADDWVPTPTINVDDASISKVEAPESSNSAPTAEAASTKPSVRKATPAISNMRSQHLTPLNSRASSPVTILNPIGAFGGRSLPNGVPSISPYNNAPVTPDVSNTPSLPQPMSPYQSPYHYFPSADAPLPSLSSADMPRLIPLFDPSDPTKPSPLAQLLPSLMRSSLWPPTQQSATQHRYDGHQPDMVHLPAELDDGQLASLAEVTREGIETRLRLLNSTQGTLQACISELQKAMTALDSNDVQGVIQVAADLNSESASQTGLSAASRIDKGKGRAQEQD